MQMKLTHYIYISAALAMFTACNDDAVTDPASSVQEELPSPIILSAGISGGDYHVETRAVANPDANHANHVLINNGAKMLLDVRGNWKHGEATNLVKKQTIATIGAETITGSKHNSLTLSTALYWDDYGMADPENAAVGRVQGLTIYGAGVNNSSIEALAINETAGTSWTDYTWTLPIAQSTAETEWEKYDLLTSNNVVYSSTESEDNAYKFSDRNNGKLLEFTHAMSKITVNLKAGDGFANHAFAADPTVTVCETYLTGTVNIEARTTNAKNESKGVITLKKKDTATTDYTATYNGLIMPGNKFADADNLIKINADDNIYYVKAKNLNDANTATDDVFERGKNYILNVTLNKTAINVSASVVAWTEVTASEAPIINISTSYSGTGSATPTGFTSFSLYRSASDPYATTPAEKNLFEYSKGFASNTADFYAPESVPTGTLGGTWTMAPVLYWPNHKTHYHFRGVWPTTVTTADASYAGGTYDWAAPRVGKNSGSTVQVIAVKNVKYTGGTFPSDLLLGMPVIASGTECETSDHTTVDQSKYGICATTGNITLDFKYMMSQVEVRLKTSTGTDQVNLSGAVVDIVDGYTTGDIQLGDGASVVSGDRGSYTLNAIDGSEERDGFAAANIRHSAIVPQALTWTESSTTKYLRFKVTITNGDGTTDIYYANIEPILKTGSTEKVAPNGKWEAGVHYIYTLDVRKTAILVTATITDWRTVNASEDIWF